MQRSCRFSLIVAAAFVLIMLAGLAAQAQDQDPRVRDRAAMAALNPINVDFKGGNGAEYVAAIRSAVPEANIVVMGELDRVLMGPVRLRNVDLGGALRVFSALPRDQPGYAVKVEVGEIRTHAERWPVYTLTAHVEPRDKPRAQTQYTMVMSMADLLGEDLKAADALTAIESALSLIKGDVAPTEIRFHEETGLLICRGAPDQIESIQQVIAQLRERAETLRTRRQSAAIADHQAKQGQASSREAQQARDEAEALRQDLTRSQTRAELMQDEVEKLQRVVASLEDEIRALRAQAQQAKGGGS